MREPGEELTFIAADLERDAGWPQAVAGCDYVLHVASPFPPGDPEDRRRADHSRPRRAVRVLRAARNAGVKRVVLTSSFAAIGYGHPSRTAPFDETSWTDPQGPDVIPYVKSKALAERAAWDFVLKDAPELELSVINPVGVFGPVLGPDYSTSILIVQRLMDGAVPGCPRLNFGVVDVRDVADLHLRAMTNPAAKGERFLAVAGDFLSMRDIAKILKRRLGAAGTARADLAAPRLPRAARRPARSGGAANPPRARQVQERQRREGQTHARLGAALQRGGDRRQRPRACVRLGLLRNSA